MIVRPAERDDHDVCARLVAALPDWFTPDVPSKVRDDLASHRGWVLDDDGVVGFAVASTRFDAAAEILWAAVDPVRWRQGLGAKLVSAVLADLASAGVRVVLVKTLDPSAGYRPYDATFAFWLSCGFRQIDTISPLPGWGEESPAALLVASTRPSRHQHGNSGVAHRHLGEAELRDETGRDQGE